MICSHFVELARRAAREQRAARRRASATPERLQKKFQPDPPQSIEKAQNGEGYGKKMTIKGRKRTIPEPIFGRKRTINGRNRHPAPVAGGRLRVLRRDWPATAS